MSKETKISLVVMQQQLLGKVKRDLIKKDEAWNQYTGYIKALQDLNLINEEQAKETRIKFISMINEI